PNRMILDREQRRLFVALDNSDFVAIIDTAREHARDADGRQRLRPGPHRPETCPESLCGSTLIFVIEDDAQDGPDHVDAADRGLRHRSALKPAFFGKDRSAVVSRT